MASYAPVNAAAVKAPSTERTGQAAPNRMKMSVPVARSSGDAPPTPAAPSMPKGVDEVPEGANGAPIELDRNDIKKGDKIGSGQEADVFRGELYGKPVAIKQFKNTRRLSVKDEIALTREIAILSKVKHPNLVSFYGTALETRPMLLVMDLCTGDTLFELLHNNVELDLTCRQNWTMSLDTTKAMAYLHGLTPPIIHRDLKSLNLLIAEPLTSSEGTPHVKVTDFGLARMKEDNDYNMTTHVGTVYWMAPEVLKGSRSYDEKVDVYSFAMVLYEIICREIPFDDLEPKEVAQTTIKGERPSQEFILKECPLLQNLMQTCWDQDPNVRPSFNSIALTLESNPL